MNIFKDAYKVERNGRVFILHWKYRFGPEMMPLAIGGMVAGTSMSMVGQLSQGKQAQDIANQNAKIQMQEAQNAKTNAAFANQQAQAKAAIQVEEGKKLESRQRALRAAGGEDVNDEASLVIQAQTHADIARDVAFTLQYGQESLLQGEQQSGLLTSEARVTKQQGANARMNSIWQAGATGLTGFGSAAYMGYSAGMFNTAPYGGNPAVGGSVGNFMPSAGISPDSMGW